MKNLHFVIFFIFISTHFLKGQRLKEKPSVIYAPLSYTTYTPFSVVLRNNKTNVGFRTERPESCPDGYSMSLYSKKRKCVKMCKYNSDCPRTQTCQNVCIYPCPPIAQSEGMKVECRDIDGFNHNCSEGGGIGTNASLSCGKYYKRDLHTMACASSGKWKPYKRFECTIDCGQSPKSVEREERQGTSVSSLLSPPIFKQNSLDWPWQGAIFRKNINGPGRPGPYEFVCGAALISRTEVLTAAHCLANIGSSRPAALQDFLVVFGTTKSNFSQGILQKSSQVFMVKKVEFPSNYDPVELEADIGLVRLSSPVVLNDFVLPVCVPLKRNSEAPVLVEGSVGYVVGFGINENERISQVLKEAELPYIGKRECLAVQGETQSASQFCAGNLYRTTICKGDSGGGIFFRGGKEVGNRFFIQGIVSHSQKKEGSRCNPGKFTIFTRLDHFSPWLIRNWPTSLYLSLKRFMTRFSYLLPPEEIDG